MGLGMGMMFLPSLAITSHYFRVKRSLAMGCVIAGEITIQSLGDFTNFPPFPASRLEPWRCNLSGPSE